MTGSDPHNFRADDPGEPSTGLPRISVSSHEAAMLKGWTSGLNVCEIGTGLGVSTMAMYEKAKSVTTVDIDPWVHETIWPTLPDNIRKLKELPDELFDIVFINGDHRPEAVQRDVHWALGHAPNVICHDWTEVRHHIVGAELWTNIPTQYGFGRHP